MNTARPATRRLLAVVAASLFVVSCGNDAARAPIRSVPVDPSTTTTVAGPTIVSFVASPETILKGQSVLLSWRISDPDAQVVIDNGIGAVTGSSQKVSPTVSTTYTLTAHSANGTAAASVAVTVSGSVPDATGSDATASDGGGSALDADSEWQNITGNLANMPSGCGNLGVLSASPNSDRLIVTIVNQGLWALTDGTEWKQIGQGAGSEVVNNRGSSIVYDPSNASTWWESGIYGPGVYRTDDDGATFHLLGNIDHSESFSADFADPARKTLLATTHERPNVSRSTDGGATWTDITAGLPQGSGNASATVIIDPQTYLLGTQFGTASAIYRTEDGGTTWTSVYPHGISGQPVVAADGTIYWLLDGSQGVVTSADHGLTWTKVADDGPAASLIQLPDGLLAAINQKQVVLSSDHGATWVGVGPQMDNDPGGVVYSASRKEFLIWRTDCLDVVNAEALWALPFTG